MSLRQQFLLSSALLPLLVAAQSSNSADGAGDPNAVPPDNVVSGAEGPDTGAFSLSRAGLIAIICVVSIIAGLGAASTILWYIAKKRQWEVRASLKRVSRRLTGRMADDRSKRQTRRTGVRMASPPRTKRTHRAREIDVEKAEEMNELRKGKDKRAPGGNSTVVTSTFDAETPRKATWKDKLFGAK